MSGFAVMFHNNYHIPLLVPLVDVPVSLNDLFERIASIDDSLELSRLNQFFELSKKGGYVPGLDLVGRRIDVEVDSGLF